MTQYSSREPFNDDPEPWLFISDQVFGVFRSPHDRGYHDVSGTYWEHAPRPEFDRPQTNPTNPILTEFRSALANYINKTLCLTHYIEYVTYGDVYGWSRQERFHAQKVLTRLASLKEES